MGEAVPRARGRKGLSKGGICRPQPTQGGKGRSYAPLGVPVLTLGMLWRPNNVWGKETGKKVLLKTPLGGTQPISVPTAKLEVCGRSCRLKGRRPEAGGSAGSRRPLREPDPRPRESKALRAKTYQTKEKTQVTRKKLSLQGSPQS